MVQRRPQVDDAALGVEAVEDVVIEVNAEGAAATVAAMERTGTAALRSAAARQPGPLSQHEAEARRAAAGRTSGAGMPI